MNNNYYWIQVNEEMNPVKVYLTKEEVEGVIKVLKEIVKENPDYLCSVADEDDEELYSNYDEWVKENKRKMFYWKAYSDDGTYEERSEWREKKSFETELAAYEDMRNVALEKMKWNTEYGEDFYEQGEPIEYKVIFTNRKIVHESYSGVYTYEIYEA